MTKFSWYRSTRIAWIAGFTLFTSAGCMQPVGAGAQQAPSAPSAPSSAGSAAPSASAASAPTPTAAAPVEASEPASAEATTVWQVPVTDQDPARGPKDALVTIVEWADFQCPYCQRVEETLKRVEQTYGSDVRIVWKDNPLGFHEHAMAAAKLGRAVFEKQGNAGFWAVHKALLERQAELSSAVLEELAIGQGLSASQWRRLAGDSESVFISDSIGAGQELGVTGTPEFFINGVSLSGAQPFEEFQARIDAELARAKARVAAGVPRAELYATLMKEAQPAPPPPRKEVAPARKDSPARGPARAKVTLEVFSDFQCPFCKTGRDTLERLEKKHPGQLRVVFRHLPLPFHEHARPAAEASEEVRIQKGNAAFWAYHDKLFAAQSEPGGLSEDRLIALAVELGVDRKKLERALASGTHRAAIQYDLDAAAAAGIRGTPSFTINGYFVSGARPLATFERLIRRAERETVSAAGTAAPRPASVAPAATETPPKAP
ncbi:MAG TPA: thioredoxin domain-containing protein [Polyangiaceae bacterium]|nr:thioredoxin domain-containing protein [Polyangiaceae bacterium]